MLPDAETPITYGLLYNVAYAYLIFQISVAVFSLILFIVYLGYVISGGSWPRWYRKWKARQKHS